MNDTKYPLLIQGVELTSCVAARRVATTVGTFLKGRKNVVMIDFFADDSQAVEGNTLTFTGGSVQVMKDHNTRLFFRKVAPFLHRFVLLCINPGQSYQVTMSTQNNPTTTDATGVMHVYYENEFDTREWNCKAEADLLTLQRQSWWINLSSGIGSKEAAQTITVPNDQGDVVAIQLTYDGAPVDAMLRCWITVQVNGVAVIARASAYFTLSDCTRKSLIFPIFIERSSEITVIVDDSNTTGQTGLYSLTLFFDQQK